MLVPEKCPICGGRVEQEEVAETLTGGGNTATVKVLAGVCQLCGEQYYAIDTVRLLEEIEGKLKKQETSEFKVIGKSFEVA
jgi:YgiT-type zinc finger domain-containing protein